MARDRTANYYPPYPNERRKGKVNYETRIWAHNQRLKLRHDQDRFRTANATLYALTQGHNMGVFCPRYDHSLIQYLIRYINNHHPFKVRFKKLHTKGKGFIGFKIFNSDNNGKEIVN